MLSEKYFFWRHKAFIEAANPKNIPVYIFTLVVFAIAWSGVKTIQDNYELQKKISVLKQQNEVIALQNGNTKLQNQYYNTNQYLDLAARQALGLAGPGESVVLVPKAVALKYVNTNVQTKSSVDPTVKSKPKYVQNAEAWRDFLLGRKILSD